ncbi:hypothetical protein NIES4071_103880 (plasmid) [Calothrix sp. NIES-4071]|nr:hypothetical protein NIES4071_103880 [Calothrix sp. NIES-4071]BAZ64375.1 hypothetical protein NIES4105_101080 [Calothrix sp. NIES-4105]
MSGTSYWSEPYNYSWHIMFVIEAFSHDIKEHQKLDAAYCWSVIEGFREDYEYYNS